LRGLFVSHLANIKIVTTIVNSQRLLLDRIIYDNK